MGKNLYSFDFQDFMHLHFKDGFVTTKKFGNKINKNLVSQSQLLGGQQGLGLRPLEEWGLNVSNGIHSQMTRQKNRQKEKITERYG
jgi:hypothetical protein